MAIYWIGVRESEISSTNDLFDGSITYFGGSENNYDYVSDYGRIVNHNHHIPPNGFFINWLKELVKDPSNKIMFYNPNIGYLFSDILEGLFLPATIGLNSREIIDITADKFKMFDLVKELVPVLDYQYKTGLEIKGNPDCLGSVVQSKKGSGGTGTVLYDDLNTSTEFSDEEVYAVTPYLEDTIPLNLHAVISDEEILILPGSVQLILNSNNHLSYSGADFIAYNEIDATARLKADEYTLKICQRLQKMGYRGVIGVDFILANQELYFMEVNNRFQSSSFLLNKALAEKGLMSLQELHLRCFGSGLNVNHADYQVPVDYSFFMFFEGSQGFDLLKSDLPLYLTDKNSETECLPADAGAFLYNGVYDTSIYHKLNQAPINALKR